MCAQHLEPLDINARLKAIRRKVLDKHQEGTTQISRSRIKLQHARAALAESAYWPTDKLVKVGLFTCPWQSMRSCSLCQVALWTGSMQCVRRWVRFWWICSSGQRGTAWSGRTRAWRWTLTTRTTERSGTASSSAGRACRRTASSSGSGRASSAAMTTS